MSKSNFAPLRPVASAAHDVPLDFDPDQRLQDALDARAFEEGITIDPRGTRIIDDGVWIRPHSKGWVLKTHIADAPSVIPHGSALEDVARARREEQDHKDGLIRIFPGTFLDRYVSLHEGVERPAITFRIELDRHGAVQDYNVYRSVFRNKQQCDYSHLRAQFDIAKGEFQGWRDLARRLTFQRQEDLAVEGDVIAHGKSSMQDFRKAPWVLENDVMHAIVHEAMLLTNVLATDFFKKRDVRAPLKMRGMYVEPLSVSPDFDFERVCNKLCWNILNHLESQKDAYVRVTSPMRNFRDYIALKMMGRLLEGKEIQPELQDHVVQFSESFNDRAQKSEVFMSGDRWRSAWNSYRQNRGEHPFHRAMQPGQAGGYAFALGALCRQEKWKWPRVAERELRLQGARIYFAGMNFSPASGQDIQSWAVSYDPNMALEMASQRLLHKIQPSHPFLASSTRQAKPSGPV